MAKLNTKFWIPKQTKIVGEQFVWLTGMGMVIGLVMIVYLLGVILVKGVDVFWPKPVAQVTLQQDAVKKAWPASTLIGIISMHQDKPGQIVPVDEQPLQEKQFFVGNKEVYGFSFKYIDDKDIAEISYPKEIIEIERFEYGDALGYPLRVQEEGKEIAFSDHKAFLSTLNAAIAQAHQRQAVIQKIEQKEIGGISRKIEKLKRQQKTLEQKGSAESVAKIQKIELKVAELNESYEILAKEARKLRDRLDEKQLVYQLAAGREMTLPVGQIVSYSFPNQMSFMTRVGKFFKNIWIFVSTEPREANTEGGVFPAIFGTFVMTVLMSIAVTPFGVVAAIYLREYAKQGLMVRIVRIAVNNLAGVPSIVFGVFGLGFFVYFVGGSIDRLFFSDALPTPTFGTGGVLWASLTLALLTVPVVIVATEEAIAAVPRGMREGSFACGASKWQTIKRIVLPASAPGILTGVILAMARGAGEVAPLMLVGVVKLAPSLPVDGIFPFFHFERKFMHLGFHIYDLGFQSPDSEAAKPMVFATTLLLIALVLVLNSGAVFIREKLRKRYARSAF